MNKIKQQMIKKIIKIFNNNKKNKYINKIKVKINNKLILQITQKNKIKS